MEYLKKSEDTNTRKRKIAKFLGKFTNGSELPANQLELSAHAKVSKNIEFTNWLDQLVTMSGIGGQLNYDPRNVEAATKLLEHVRFPEINPDLYKKLIGLNELIYLAFTVCFELNIIKNDLQNQLETLTLLLEEVASVEEKVLQFKAKIDPRDINKTTEYNDLVRYIKELKEELSEHLGNVRQSIDSTTSNIEQKIEIISELLKILNGIIFYDNTYKENHIKIMACETLQEIGKQSIDGYRQQIVDTAKDNSSSPELVNPQVELIMSLQDLFRDNTTSSTELEYFQVQDDEIDTLIPTHASNESVKVAANVILSNIPKIRNLQKILEKRIDNTLDAILGDGSMMGSYSQNIKSIEAFKNLTADQIEFRKDFILPKIEVEVMNLVRNQKSLSDDMVSPEQQITNKQLKLTETVPHAIATQQRAKAFDAIMCTVEETKKHPLPQGSLNG